MGYEDEFRKRFGIGFKDIKQVAEVEEREVTINVLYGTDEIWVYTNVSKIMRRILKMGYKPTEIQLEDGQIFSMDFRLPMEEYKSFLKVSLFS